MNESSKQLYGEVIKSGSLSGFEYSETAYPANLKLPFHTHNFAYFCYVLEGDFTEKRGQTEDLCQTSTLIFHPPGESHADSFHTPARCFNFQINSEVFERANAASGRISGINAVQKSSELDKLVTRLYKETGAIDEFSVLTAEGLMLEIIAEFLRQSKVKSKDGAAPRWLISARELISEEFTENLTISSVAAVAGVHPTHLAREFRRYFHLTIGDFIRQKRIEFACRKIVNSNAPLSEIAAESGFFDQSHLTRVFKKATGMTPNRYRRIFNSANFVQFHQSFAIRIKSFL